MARFSVPVNSGGGGDVSFTEEGCIVLPNDGEICNTADSSGDGYGYSTISINPDTNTNDNRYIIIDPTAPNHIHIRAGGEQDESNADLFLGGERNNVLVSDNERGVGISTRPATVINTYTNDNLTSSATFVTSNASDINIGYVVNVGGFDYIVDEIANNVPEEGLLSVAASGASFTAGASYVFTYEPEENNQWVFDSDGYLYGPAMGGLFVNGLLNGEGNLWLSSNDNVVLTGYEGGEFIGNADFPENQIATIGDVTVASNSPDTSFTVVGGTLGTQPTFSGAPLFTGSYVKHGVMVHFRMDIDFDNITSFGTGQYYLDLPFPAKYNYEFTAGCVHDISTSRDYALTGHVYAGDTRMLIKSLDNAGSTTFAVPFTSTSPFTLAVADNFHICGDYIAEDAP